MLKINHGALWAFCDRHEKNATGASVHDVRQNIMWLSDCLWFYVKHKNAGDYDSVMLREKLDFKAQGMERLRRLGEPEELWDDFLVAEEA